MAALAVLVWPLPPAPLAWLGPDGGNAAMVLSGKVTPMRPDRRMFATESFAQHRGLEIDPLGDHFACNRDHCLGPASDHPRIAAWFTRRRPSSERMADLCDSDILVLDSAAELPTGCVRPLVLRSQTFRTFGAAEVLATPSGWTLDWTSAHRGRWPWTRPPTLVSDSVE